MPSLFSFKFDFRCSSGFLRRTAAPAVLCLAAMWATLGRAQQPTPPSPSSAATSITLAQAIDLAIAHNHALLAARTQIQQSQAEEVTAAIRPNPTLGVNSLFIPFNSASADNINQLSEFDAALGYTFERGGKRNRRIEAARDQTAVTESQVADTERGVVFNTAQQYINALLAKSNVELAEQDAESFQKTVNIGQEQFRAGAISEGDLLKIKLQMLQFQTDLASARVSLAQALASLRQLVGYESVTADYQLADDLKYEPLKTSVEDLQARALATRPDLRAAQQGITAAKSQYELARANGKRDLNGTFQYSHVSGLNTGGLLFSMEIPIFDRNQGEIARTRYAITQAQEDEREAGETVMTDIRNAYEALKSNRQIVELYTGGYLKQAQDSRDISAYAYQRGAASLLDFLDAERSYRASQLGYRQALASYMQSLEQLRQAVGTRNLQ
jgi:cobalt-zinc-cadmium efflux system outer membrane protein